MRVSDYSFFRDFLSNFRSARVELSEAVGRLADGKRVRVPSDAPADARVALSLRATAVRLEGYVTSAKDARGDLATLDGTIGEAIQQVTAALSEAMAGTAAPLSEGPIRAETIDSIRRSLLDLANRQTRGRYLFSGQETLTVPFDAGGGYGGDDAEVQAPITTALRVGATLSGRRTFQGAPGDLFRQLDDLAAAFRAGDTAGVQNAVGQLNSQIRHLAGVRSQVGVRLQEIDRAVVSQEDELVRVYTRIGEIEDVGIERAALDVAAAESQLQSLSATAARVLGRSLFDYLG